ncbi:cysteine--1-D-myo-inosityl 2-amino-2-deoxy-alpha-D-glucopyranoside ligase [Microbacterium sp. MPKO10]|uniref:cysteine--1-D-myo-inosityl 2-amino-2-deoxy-alpha-D-glucopyranoside ligase n=1 Tax=Microbacterium sp. MPKO10 TaxID=2989818 RepID=UPI002235FCC6|nr:cysteine--1-D-myo-inosityl 2-amino-2-deoxy-alpha-D-glucopyranoside ligase [Microbacterium sp. MPKO10]MCW4459455.1 cysteine--1-D-myo-inosityl 2-amino-2-deoxy-alpha-D-glucopyranoside ligase [Microbacterium sp. MPKO10]
MQSWPTPEIPVVPGESTPPCLWDTATASLVEAQTGETARLYVCGITPYDATHMGHAATYVAYDTLQRVWRDAGLTVHYAQNITDIDDPLLERATATNVSWRDLADEQIDLFRHDMEALAVIPPDDFIAVTEVIEPIGAAVERMLQNGTAYRVDTPDSPAGDDVYFDIAAAEAQGVWTLGSESGYDRDTMLALSRERGGDPDRTGKRDPIDPLVWRSARPGEPQWPSPLGNGRPGWHIECSVIALRELGADFTVQGGGSDLVFPHHELSAAHAAALSGRPLARVFSHTGMVAYQGEKMSKSLGNLVRVSDLRAQGVDARNIRLAILAHHYRADWEWTDDLVPTAADRIASWSRGLRSDASSGASTSTVLHDLRAALRHDLDTPAALAIADEAAHSGVDDAGAVRAAIHALLGIKLD